MAEQNTQDEAAEEVVDPERERNLKVTAMMEDGFYDRLAKDADYRTVQDGGAGEDLPLAREGEVFESLAAEDDDVGGGRRRVRVQTVDEDGTVRAVNLVTGVVSHIEAGNLVPPRWRRAHS